MAHAVACKANQSTRLSVLALSLLVPPTVAQQAYSTTPQPSLPVYDIVSVRPHNALDDHAGFSDPPDGFIGANVTLRELVSYAYHIREDLISGFPAWVDSTHFDLAVKVSDPDHSVMDKLSREQTRAMLRPVLADRFQLKIHTQIDTLPIYDLVIMKGGPKFQKSPPPPDDPDHPTLQGQYRKTAWQINDGSLVATALPMSILANALAGELDRTVIDKTGLTGRYDLKLRWTSDPLAANPGDDGTTDRPPDLFTAIKEQLGLKLDPSKGPVTTLVVDHAEKPTPN